MEEEQKKRKLEVDSYGRWARCGLCGGHNSQLCAGFPQGPDGPLSCVWSRSLEGGRVGGGWQTEGKAAEEEEEEEGEEEEEEGRRDEREEL